MKVVYTAGVFDLLHRGHLNLLWESKKLGDLLVVGVVSDVGCYAYKGLFPRQNIQLRLREIRRLDFVDVAVIQDETDPTPGLQRFMPDIFTHADGAGTWSELRERVAAAGVEYVNIPYTEGISSTVLRRSSGATFGKGERSWGLPGITKGQRS